MTSSRGRPRLTDASCSLEPRPIPSPETSGDAGAAAFLHGPQGHFGSAAPPDTPDTPDTPEDNCDDQVHGEGEVAAR
ncbi:hypothetical protein [Streptomyces sp. NPDC001507]|uniref:hypothetical protein n=1 Tax=Streptomyces sp. NPDC001507 TaxID=3364579 RepID=UPI003689ABF9